MARDEPNEPFECSLRETVGVQADFEHVHTKPRPARHNIADDGAVDKAALADHATPAQMQNQRVPKHDDQRAILLRVPTPEAAPGLVRPDATQHGPDKTEQRGETDDAINHPRQSPARRRIQRPREYAAHDVNERQGSSDERASVTQCHDHDVRGEPEIGVQHGAHHFHCIASQREVVSDDERDKTDGC